MLLASYNTMKLELAHDIIAKILYDKRQSPEIKKLEDLSERVKERYKAFVERGNRGYLQKEELDDLLNYEEKLKSQYLNEAETGYVEKSRKEWKRKRRNNWIMAITASVLIIGFGVFGGVMYKKSNDNLRALNEVTTTTFGLNVEQYIHAINLGNWSAYQGRMNWNDAVKKCKSIGARLPKVGEFKSIYGRNELEEWKKKGYDYWTREEFSVARAYSFVIVNGFSLNYPKDDVLRVRCIF